MAENDISVETSPKTGLSTGERVPFPPNSQLDGPALDPTDDLSDLGLQANREKDEILDSATEIWQRATLSQQSRVQKVLTGGRITIPIQDRKKLKLKEGDFVAARIQGNSFVVTPLDFEVRKQ